MDAVVLCGGAGTRVKEITNDAIPKILIPLHGTPFIDYMIDALLIAGIRRIYFAAGFLGEQIEDYLNTKLSYAQRRYGEYEVVIEDEPMGTGGALKKVMAFYWDRQNSHILVANGDTVVYGPKVASVMIDMSRWIWKDREAPDYRTHSIAYARLMESDGSRGLFNAKVKGGYPYRVIQNEGPNDYFRIETFDEKIAGHGYTNVGWYLLSANIFSEVLDWPNKCSIEYDLLPKWVTENEFYYLDFCGEPSRILDIGTTERINKIHAED